METLKDTESAPDQQHGRMVRVARGLAHVAGAVVGAVEGMTDFAVEHGFGQFSAASNDDEASVDRIRGGDDPFFTHSEMPESWGSSRRT